MLCSIEEAVEEIKKGGIIIVVDDEARENEGDFVMAAEKITPEAVNFMSKHGRGLICIPLTRERTVELQLDQMMQENTELNSTAFTVSVDSINTGSGISTFDRATTILELVDSETTPEQLRKPGHVFPLRAENGGVLKRAGHTEAAVDLCKIAGLKPAGVICEVLNEDGTMARLPQLEKIAETHALKIVSIEQLIQYKLEKEKLVHRCAEAVLPTNYGDFNLIVFKSNIDKAEHVALVKGEWQEDEPILVRVHSQCLTGDVFSSKRCDCGEQLQIAMEKISSEKGVLLYLRQEGRGIGLANKIRAYKLQEKGFDTIEANQMLGFKDDLRDYGIGAQILRDLGVRKMKLLTNNPRKITGIRGYGLEVVETIQLKTKPNKHNESYLETKREKMGHLL